MYHAIVFYPNLSRKLGQGINAIRSVYDPTARLIDPHITICYPVSGHDAEDLADHVRQIASRWPPFVIQFGGFRQSRDHWLFLMVQDGADGTQRLHDALLTGPLACYARSPGERGYDMTVHLSLGHFLKRGHIYDRRNPRESDFDETRYADALRQAQALPLPERVEVDRLYLIEIPDGPIEWMTGQRAGLPEDAVITRLGEFALGE